MIHLPDKDLTRLEAHIAATGSPKGFVPTPRKPRRNDESQMQRNLIRWWRMACRGFGVPELCLFSVPNGFNADARRGSVMKAEGQRRGCPDLFLSVPQTDRNQGRSDNECHEEWLPDLHGLFLELKTATGRLSPEQEVYHEILRRQGYRVEVCRSLDECVKTITEYLT
jgi:hypothetical protein